MIRGLNLRERHWALALSVALGLLGLAMAGAARQGPTAVHGGMALVLGLGLIFAVGGALYDVDAPAGRMSRYYDDPTRFGIVITLVWAVIGIGVGVWDGTMSLPVLIPQSLGMGAVGLAAFFWALHHQQFDDPEGPAWRVIPTNGNPDKPDLPKE